MVFDLYTMKLIYQQANFLLHEILYKTMEIGEDERSLFQICASIALNQRKLINLCNCYQLIANINN